MSISRRSAAAAAMAALAIAVPAASAQGPFAPAQRMVTDAVVDGPALQITADGTVRARWTGVRGGGQAVSPPGTTGFGTVGRIPPLAVYGSPPAFDGGGAAWVVGSPFPSTDVAAVHLPAGGRPGRPQLLETGRKSQTPEPELAVNARGDALAAWIDGDGSNGVRVVTAWRPAGGRWQVRRLDATTDEPVVALSDGGAAAVAFHQGATMRVARLARTGRWQRPQVVGVAQPASRHPAHLVMNARGDAVLAWADGVRGGETDEQPGPVRFFAAVSAAGHGFRAAQLLHSAPIVMGDERAPRAAVGADGRVAVAWQVHRIALASGDTPAAALTVERGTIAGGLGAGRQVLTSGPDLYAADVAMSPSGSVTLATWIEGTTVRTAVAHGGAPFAGPTTILTAQPASGYDLVGRAGDRRMAVALTTHDPNAVDIAVTGY